MTDRNEEKPSDGVLQEIFGSDLCASEESSVAPESTVPSPCPPPTTPTRRRVYSKKDLRTLRHDCVLSLPNIIRKSFECPIYETPTLMPNEPTASSSRRVYSEKDLRALRHDRVLPLPKIVTKPLERPRYEIPTLKSNEPTAFSTLSLPKELLDSLSSLSLTTASAIQSTAIPYARLGGDLVAQATSGTGKTLTYALVALDTILPSSPTRSAFVIVPTRELAYQVADVFSKLAAIRVITLVGGTKERLDEENLSKPANIIVGTPGRVEVMVSRGAVDVSSIKILVLDEADRLLDGSFDGSVERICNMIPTRQTLAFSATFSYSFRVSLMEVMRGPAWIGGSDVVHSVVQRKVECRDLQHKISVLKGMLQPMNLSLCLVFLNAKKAAGRLVRTLNKSLAFVTKLFHADVRQKDRDAVIKQVRQGKVQVLVTTDVLARGIDIDSCDMVIHMDVPQTAETYLHRVGRAGRFGRKGSSTVLFEEAEVSAVLALEADLGFDIKSPTVPNSENVFMPIKSRSDGPKTDPQRGEPVIKSSEEGNRWNRANNLEIMAQRRIEALENTSHAASPPPCRTQQAVDDDPVDLMDVERVTTPVRASDFLINSPHKVVEPSSQINLKRVSQKQCHDMDSVAAKGTVSGNTREDMPSENRPNKIQLSSLPYKRPRHLDEPATPAKKRKSARTLFQSSPNHEIGGFKREQLERNMSPEEARQGNSVGAKEGENQGFHAPGYPPLENLDDNEMEVEMQEASMEEAPRKTCHQNSNAGARRTVSPRAREIGSSSKDRVAVVLLQREAETAGVPVPNEQYQNSHENMHDERVAGIPVCVSPDSFTDQSREAWDKYAAAAYDAGYREAYEEAFQMAERLRWRLSSNGR